MSRNPLRDFVDDQSIDLGYGWDQLRIFVGNTPETKKITIVVGAGIFVLGFILGALIL